MLWVVLECQTLLAVLRNYMIRNRIDLSAVPRTELLRSFAELPLSIVSRDGERKDRGRQRRLTWV